MKRLAVLVLGVTISLSSLTFAQVVADRKEIRLAAKPGERASGSFFAVNTSNKEAKVKVYLEDFVYKPPFEGLKEPRPLDSTPHSCGKWVTLSPQEFNLPSKGKKEIQYSINIPQEASGGYYSLIFIEKKPEGTVGNTGIAVKIKSGFAIFVETTDKIKKGELRDIIVDKDKIQGYLVNAGNTVLISQGTFHVMDKKNLILDRGEFKKLYLPAAEKASFTVNVPQKVSPGTYTLFLNFDLEGKGALIKEIDFLKDESGNLEIIKIQD